MNIPVPRIIISEITSRCNASCVFCTRDPICCGDMPIDMFISILDDFPETKEIHPTWIGESMLHPKFGKIIEEIKRRNKKIILYTNGSLVHLHIDALKLFSAGDMLIFSVEGRDAVTYESIRRGLKWDRLIDNIAIFKSIKAPGVKLRARITACREIIKDISAVCNFWKSLTDDVVVQTEKPLVRKIAGKYVHRACSRPLEHMTIRSNGELALCCIDYHGELGLPNVSGGARLAWDKSLPQRNCNHSMCNQCLYKFVPNEDLT